MRVRVQCLCFIFFTEVCVGHVVPESFLHFASTEAQEKRRKARDEIKAEQDQFHQELKEKKKRLDKELEDQAKEEKFLEEEVQRLRKVGRKKESKAKPASFLEQSDMKVNCFISSLLLLVLGGVAALLTRARAAEPEDYLRHEPERSAGDEARAARA
ncbi:unnamed protein product [Durusdinium trenchii]|uniref:Uncharacterized protein n=1 Tax=Durusdinium trenchii TaxID=1381693 RepID=A0ABP0N7A7_9DINO